MRRTKTSATTVAIALLAASAATSNAHAASSRDVDPAILTPALNPTFVWHCAAAGDGIRCRGERHTTYGPEPAGFDCAGGPVLVLGRGDDVSTRWHGSDDRVTRTVTQRSFDDRLVLAGDDSGGTVHSTQRWVQHYDYRVPGDLASRVLTETGRIRVLRAPGTGTLLRYTGYAEFAPGEDFETLVAEHGRNDFARGVDVVEAVCGALT